jgi:hypothetical protein
MAERTELLELLWEHRDQALFLTKDQYLSSLTDWEIRPHYEGTDLVGATMTNGPQFHFATFGNRWTLTRAHIRQYLLPLLERYGFVTTSTPNEDARQSRFNRLIGFSVAARDEYFTHYKLERLRHA